MIIVVVVQSLSCVWLFVTPWTATHQAPLFSPISQNLLKLMSMMPSSHLILCHPLLFLLSIFPSIRDFSNESFFPSGSQSIGASASASVLPMNIQGWFPLGLTGLISLQSKGLKSILQCHNSKASVFQPSAFFMVQLSHLYMTTGKTIALTRLTFVGKVMSLLFNTLSKFITAFLPRSKQSIFNFKPLPPVILQPKKRKSVTASTFSPSICY